MVSSQIVRAEDVYFWDVEGNRCLDFSSQLVCANLGHNRKEVNEAISLQMDKVSYIAPSFTTEVRAKLSKKLADLSLGNLTKTFFLPVERKLTREL